MQEWWIADWADAIRQLGILEVIASSGDTIRDAEGCQNYLKKGREVQKAGGRFRQSGEGRGAREEQEREGCEGSQAG
jgi:hypothetical protein